MQALSEVGDRQVKNIRDPNDPLLRQELYRFVYEMLAQGYFVMVYQDPKHPDFLPVFNQAFPVGFANPDDSYYQAVVDDKVQDQRLSAN